MILDERAVAAKLGVTLDTVRKWQTRHLLPKPDRLPVKRGWEEETIERWAQRTQRMPGGVYEPGGETEFEREMRLAREAARL